MAVVVVAGQARKVGKTSVVCELIAAMLEREWVAIKVSSHGHGHGHGARFSEVVAGATKQQVPFEDDNQKGKSKGDSARYLAAGAVGAFFLSAPEGQWEEVMPRVREIIAEARNVLVESNGVLEFLQPDLLIAVIDPAVGDFKDSLKRHVAKVDAVVVPEGEEVGGMFAAKRIFRSNPPSYCSEGLVAFVRGVLDTK